MRRKLGTWKKFRLWFLTLFYHTSISYEYCFDVCLEPLFWFIDEFLKYLGPLFIVAVITLIGLVVSIAHALGLPFWWNKSPSFTIVLIVIGYWILTNVAFHFYQAATISPGEPKDENRLANCSVTICKKCINPKPPRTHHCSICNRCYLNMDHHCPWVNNCIGHFNRRYFLFCMVFIVAGCIFIMLFGVELAYRQIIVEENVFPVAFIEAEELTKDSKITSIDEEKAQFEILGGNTVTLATLRFCIYFVGTLCIGVALALGGLTLWHMRLITRGETSIEYHLNKFEKKKSKDFVNPYDLGWKKNWIVFLGFDRPGINWLHILFPSTHLPSGDGYDWSFLALHATHDFSYDCLF